MYISLTFDDGPNTDTSEHVLDVLEEFGARASFFLVGENVSEKTAPTMKRQLELGCTLENHSWNHAAFPQLSAQEMLKQIEDTNAVIEKFSGQKPMFFRPPYIALNQLMYDTIKMPFICGVGCDDWKQDKAAEAKSSEILANACDGQIVLLHDASGNETTVEALRTIIPALQKQGYEFVNIRELFEKFNVCPNKKDCIWSNVL